MARLRQEISQIWIDSAKKAVSIKLAFYLIADIIKQ